MVKILFIGDIVGRPGREILAERLGHLRREVGADVVIANGENAAAGSGINESIARSLLALGIDAITLGDHVWDQRGWDSDIGQFERVSRPANLAPGNPGRDHLIVNVNGFRLGIITLLGRHFLKQQADCPFRAVDDMLARLKDQVDGVFVEMHAEATSEKQAMGWHLDGRAIAVLGTHTHVPTADATVLPGGTAFMCDVGMTGPYASILGRIVEPVLGRFIDGMPRRLEIAEGDVRISGALVEYDEAAKRAVRVELVTVRRNNAELASSRL